MTHESAGTNRTRSGALILSRLGIRSVATAVLFSALTFTVVQTAGAQGRGRADERGRSDERVWDDARGRGSETRGSGAQRVPPGHLPPPGQCRVWYDRRPPGQQPAPTSCANARATVARAGSRDNARVIYGDDVRRKAGGRNDDRKDDRRDRDRRGDDRGDGDRGDYDRRDDDRRRDAACDDKDRRKGECTYDRGRGDGPYPERNGERYPDRAGNPSNRDYPRTLPDMMLGVGYGRGERLNEVRQWLASA